MDAATLEESATPAFGPRDLARTGTLVSAIGLDGAAFGWATGIDQTSRILDAYAAGGGNLISTADHYAGGRSEIMIGSWLRTVSDRSRFVLETRVGRHPDAVGLGKRAMLRAVENSLTRLGTDYVDFLSFDGEDPKTPIEESLETGHRLISEGKVRFLSASGFGVDAIRQVEQLADESGGPRFRALLIEYNLMVREQYEGGLQPIAVEMGRGALARLPLAHGYLGGPARGRDESARGVMFEEAKRHIGRRGDRVTAALTAVAKELGESPSRVALAWVLLKPGIASALLRAKDSDQVERSLGAVNVRLARHQVAALDRASVA